MKCNDSDALLVEAASVILGVRTNRSVMAVGRIERIVEITVSRTYKRLALNSKLTCGANIDSRAILTKLWKWTRWI